MVGQLKSRAARVARASVVAAVVLALAGCGAGDGPEAAAPAAPAVVEIGAENVVRVAPSQISVGPLVSGELRAEREATVRAEIGGSIIRVGPEEGQSVKRGGLLARIEARAQQDAYLSAQSSMRSSEEALQIAERELERTERLVKAGALAERDLEAARNAAISARAQRDDARARLTSARKAMEDATVRSPMTGIVARRHVSAGDVVSLGTELYQVIDPSSMRLEASMASDQIGAVTVGAPVSFEVRGYPGQTFEGHIERISPTADPVTRQVSIFVAIPNTGGRLVAGLFAQGRVLTEARTGLVVPSTVVNDRGGKPWVMRVRDGKAERVEVTLGLRDEQTERVEIASGVQQGDVLLVGAAQGMTPGTPVRVRNGAPSEE
jgi:membrane fusion protein (multidrug efflux system)